MYKLRWFYLFIFINIYVPSSTAQVKNVILMIGDGMGPTIVGATKYYSEFVLGKKLYMEQVMNQGYTGYMITYSSTHIITDSAASATAIATGLKTYNLAVGVDSTGKAQETILEFAQRKKKTVGLVTTDMLTGATPASFATHVTDRKKQDEIALGYLDRQVNVMFGGGEENFTQRADKRNLVTEFRQKGYTVVKTKPELIHLTGQKISYVLGLFANKTMNYYRERTPDEPSLPEMVTAALKILKQNSAGFFLVVEAARIDHAAHQNSPENVVYETLEFDQAIGTVWEYVKSNPRDTLLIITSDHDTGGMQIGTKPGVHELPTVKELAEWKNIYWLSDNHTGSPVFLFGYGNGAEKLTGMHENTDLAPVIRSLIEGVK